MGLPQFSVAADFLLPFIIAPATGWLNIMAQYIEDTFAAIFKQQTNTRTPQQQIIEMLNLLMPGTPAEFKPMGLRARNNFQRLRRARL